SRRRAASAPCRDAARNTRSGCRARSRSAPGCRGSCTRADDAGWRDGSLLLSFAASRAGGSLAHHGRGPSCRQRNFPCLARVELTCLHCAVAIAVLIAVLLLFDRQFEPEAARTRRICSPQPRCDWTDGAERGLDTA